MELAKRIVEEATEKAYAIVKEAKEEKKRAIGEEEKRLKQEYKKEIERFTKLIEERRREEEASMRLELKRAIDRAYEEKFNEVLDRLAEKLKAFRKDKEYKKMLNSFVEKAREELGVEEKNLVIHVVKGDKKLIKTRAVVKEDLDDIGGIVAETKDGKIRVNLSFSNLIESKKEELRQRAMQELSKVTKPKKKRK